MQGWYKRLFLKQALYARSPRGKLFLFCFESRSSSVKNALKKLWYCTLIYIRAYRRSG